MGKYIIDVGEGYIRHGLERTLAILVKINDYGNHWIDTRIPLTPYTEHDLEQIRKEAFKNGYDAACKDIDIKSKTNAAYRKGCQDATVKISSDEQAIAEEAYQSGLKDAWEAARKIVCRISDGGYRQDLLDRIFGNRNCQSIMAQYSASDAVEKISKYEPEEQITKGDVVRIKSAPEVEIFVTYVDGGHVGGIALTEVDDSCEIGDQFTDITIHKVEKTGKHYEIAEVLAKMKEEES